MLEEEDNFDSQVRDSSLSLSLPSEPPDIRNWFSSYKYESPASDTLHDFRCSSFEGSQSEKEELNPEDRNRVNDENLEEFRNTKLIDEKIAPIGFVQYKRENKLEDPHLNERNHDGEENKDWYGCNDLCSKKIGEQGWAEIRFQNLDTEPTKVVKKSSRNNNEENFPELEENKRSGKNGERSGLPESSLVNGDSKKKTNLVSNDTENGGKEIAENGFVSTRKNRVRGENDKKCFNESQKFELKCSRKRGIVLSTTEKNVGERRKVLAEKTNLKHSDGREIAGKWRCPQKEKPDLGPPLKQLRLERWVHRL